MIPVILLIVSNYIFWFKILKCSGIDPQDILKEREYRISQRMALRLKELETYDDVENDNLKLRANIEAKAIRLIEFQKKVFTCTMYWQGIWTASPVIDEPNTRL